jgi:hypothetical protein
MKNINQKTIGAFLALLFFTFNQITTASVSIITSTTLTGTIEFKYKNNPILNNFRNECLERFEKIKQEVKQLELDTEQCLAINKKHQAIIAPCLSNFDQDIQCIKQYINKVDSLKQALQNPFLKPITNMSTRTLNDHQYIQKLNTIIQESMNIDKTLTTQILQTSPDTLFQWFFSQNFVSLKECQIIANKLEPFELHLPTILFMLTTNKYDTIREVRSALKQFCYDHKINICKQLDHLVININNDQFLPLSKTGGMNLTLFNKTPVLTLCESYAKLLIDSYREKKELDNTISALLIHELGHFNDYLYDSNKFIQAFDQATIDDNLDGSHRIETIADTFVAQHATLLEILALKDLFITTQKQFLDIVQQARNGNSTLSHEILAKAKTAIPFLPSLYDSHKNTFFNKQEKEQLKKLSTTNNFDYDTLQLPDQLIEKLLDPEHPLSEERIKILSKSPAYIKAVKLYYQLFEHQK